MDVNSINLSYYASNLQFREKVLRLLQYSSLACRPFLSPPIMQVVERLCMDISKARLVFRQFDVIPAYHEAVMVHNKDNSKSGVEISWILELLGCVCDCLFYPVEGAAWCLQDNYTQSKYFQDLALRLWALSLTFAILRCCHSLLLCKRRKETTISLIQYSADMANALTYMRSRSPNFTKIGVWGSVSSAIMLYKVIRQIRPQQQH